MGHQQGCAGAMAAGRAAFGDIPRRAGEDTFGVACNGDEEGNFDYIAGVEVTDWGLAISRPGCPEKKATFNKIGLGKVRPRCPRLTNAAEKRFLGISAQH
jgi:hypothetical protein